MTAFLPDRPAPAEIASAHLTELRRAFGVELEQRITRLRSLTEKASNDVQPLREAYRVAHGLVGAGGTFGYPEVSRHAQAIELVLQRAIAADAPLGRVESNRVVGLVEALGPMIADNAGQDLHDAGARDAEDAPVFAAGDDAPREILMIGRDRAEYDHLAREICPYGYSLSRLLDPDNPMVGHLPPTAGVLVDTGSAQEIPVRLATSRKSPWPDGVAKPMIVLSDRDDAAMRLASVRHGSTAFLTKPVDVNRLVEHLQAGDRKAEEPLRVVVVEDDALLARLYVSVLESAGMVTQHATKPESVLEALAAFRPDLILMDLYLDDLEGTELAQVIRQHGDYLSVPILFLSGESDLNTQLFARTFGADDFLTKPIAPPQLVSAVRSRALRYRELRHVIERDPLTGLLNHLHLRGRLEHDLGRTERLGGCLSYAMIDVDHFKKVNDTYGHLAGDAVLKALARMLRQRLRKTDSVGRYGGEEFAIILPDAELKDAAAIMNDLRESFARLQHGSAPLEFSATFSCGIASYPDLRGAEHLRAAADEALYKAKRSGRNCVVY